MSALPVVLLALAGLTMALLRWRADELEQQGRLSGTAAAASTALLVLHAFTVMIAAGGEVWPIGVPLPVAVALAVVAGGVGLVLLAGAVRQMRSPAQISGREPGELVTGGVYARSRHPQYLGWGLVLLALALGGRSGLALALVAAYALGAWRFAAGEEQHLARAFGDRWARYRAATPALLTGRRGTAPRP